MNFLRSLLLKNIGLKAISLLLAVLLWFQIAGQQVVQRAVPVPVEFINMPVGLEITNDYTKRINVFISKRSSVQLDESRLAAVFDLSEAEPGTEVIPVTDANIRGVPYDAEVVGIEERRIRLELERTRRKIVEVKPEIVGEPAPGFVLREVRLSPAEVLISGPESRVASVTTAETEPINITGRRQSFVQDVYLDLEDPRLRIETAASVDAFVVIEEQRREVRLGRLPVVLVPPDSPVRIEPAQVEVFVSVPVSFEREISPEEFRALVRVGELDLEAGPVEIIPEVVIPDQYQEVVRVERVEAVRAVLRQSQ